MKHLEITINPEVVSKFNRYPEEVRRKMLELRNLIIETAEETKSVTSLEETLKWGEPSYVTKYGSTIRIDWKSKSPNQYAMYFQCTSKLIPTFKLMYHNVFEFEGSRALIFPMNTPLPTNELKKCISTALQYHKVKHLASLGL